MKKTEPIKETEPTEKTELTKKSEPTVSKKTEPAKKAETPKKTDVVKTVASKKTETTKKAEPTKKTEPTKKATAVKIVASKKAPKLIDENEEKINGDSSTDLNDLSDPESADICDSSVIEDELLETPEDIDLEDDSKSASEDEEIAEIEADRKSVV